MVKSEAQKSISANILGWRERVCVCSSPARFFPTKALTNCLSLNWFCNCDYVHNRKTGAEDVVVKVLYCGICHTDLHQTKNHLGASKYPMVPG
jgi:hypothetical protein